MKRPIAAAIVGLSLQLSSGVPLRADAPEPGALLERAIAFHGGRSALQNLPNLKSSGTFEGGGRMVGRAMDAVYYDRADGALRSEVAFEFRGRTVTAVTMFDGAMCKRRSRSTWDDIPPDENRDRAAHRLPFLLQALTRDPVVAGEGEEAGAAVWRLEVPDGRGKAVLSLAKDDGRLVALEYPGTEAEGMGTKKEVMRKVVHHGFQKAGSVQVPDDIEMFMDGVFDGRLRFERIEVISEWDDGWLQLPDLRRRFIPGEELAF